MNYFTDPDMTLKIVVYTVLYGCVIGYIYAILFLKTKNLAVVMFLHFSWDFTSYCNEKMVVEKYRYGGDYSFLLYQGLVLLVMVVVISVLLCKSTAEELSLHAVPENGKEGDVM